MAKIEVGDLVWILANSHSNPFAGPNDMTIKGVVMSQLDESWYRVYSSYRTSAGEKTNIQDFPSSMLSKVY